MKQPFFWALATTLAVLLLEQPLPLPALWEQAYALPLAVLLKQPLPLRHCLKGALSSALLRKLPWALLRGLCWLCMTSGVLHQPCCV